MKPLRKFLLFPTAERRLLVKATLLLGAIRLGLWLIPFRSLRRLLAEVTEVLPGSQEVEQFSIERVVWAVEAAGRHIPGVGTCLTQALAVQVLLARRGHPSLLHIGLAKDEEGQLEAHAWLESGGEVVIGGSELDHYRPLVALEDTKL